MRMQIVALVLGLSMLYAAPLVPAQLGGESSGAMVCVDDRWECWQGVPGADVTLSKGGLLPASHDAKTDEEGYFQFDDVESGTYTLSITRAGFKDYEASVEYPFQSKSFPLKADNVTVAGTVVNEAGAGVAGARISSWGEYGEWETESSDDGSFSMRMLAGYRYFHVSADEYLAFDQELFIDGSDISFTLLEAPPTDASVSGTIRDQDGKPVAGAVVEGYQWGYYDDEAGRYYEYGYDERNMRTQSDANGHYRLDARAGEVNLNFWKDGYAHANAWFELEAGEDAVHDVKMLKYPEKTAKIEGRLYDAKTGESLRWANINFQSVEFGMYGCSQYEGDAHHAHGEPEPAYAYEESPDGDYASDAMIAPYPYYRSCDITIHDDGTFTGNVTPGYTTVNVWYDHWQSCTETSSSDGSYSRTCGQDYFGWVGTFDLAENSTTKMNIGLQPRPGADATVQGYAVDAETGKAIPGARFSFSNQDGYAWGEAQTDKDGSYKVKIRSGYQHVHVWADGYFPWQGVVQVQSGKVVNFDVKLTAGQSQYGYYGGCCYDDVAYASHDGDDASEESAPQASGAPIGEVALDSSRNTGSGNGDFEDLKGGLGPYDAQKRERELQSGEGKKSPGLEAAILVMTLGVLVWVQRRS